MVATVGSVVVSLEGRVQHLERSLAAGATSVRRFETTANLSLRRFEAVQSRVAATTAATTVQLRRFGAVAGSFGILGGGLGVVGLMRYADGFTRIQNQLKVAGLEGEKLRGTFSDLFRIAQRHGTAIEPLATLYSRLAQAQTELGASGADLTRFTEGVALALRVQGTDAAGAAGALLQLSQALGSSIVRAEEFNSVNEGARPILQAVANGLKDAGGSVSKLRAIVVDGKLSNAAFFRAFLAGMSDLEAKAASAAPTIAQNFTRLNNSLTVLVGGLDSVAGAGTAAGSGLANLAGGIEALASNEDRLRTVVELAERLLAAYVGLRVGSLAGPWGALFGTAVGAASPEIRRGLGFTTDPAPLGVQSTKADLGGISLSEFGARFGGATTSAVSLADFPIVPGASEIDDRTDAWKRENGAIRDNIVQLYGFADGLDLTTDRVTELAGAGREFFGSFVKDLAHGVDATEALTTALGRLSDRLLDLALDTAFNAIAGSLTGQTTTVATLFHSGGVVGRSGGIKRTVPAASFVSAPRFHTGLTGKEFPAILERGERVLTAEMASRNAKLISGFSRAAAGAGGGDGIVINVIEAPGGDKADVRQNSDGSIDVIMRRVRGEVARDIADNGVVGRAIGNTFRGIKRNTR